MSTCKSLPNVQCLSWARSPRRQWLSCVSQGHPRTYISSTRGFAFLCPEIFLHLHLADICPPSMTARRHHLSRQLPVVAPEGRVKSPCPRCLALSRACFPAARLMQHSNVFNELRVPIPPPFPSEASLGPRETWYDFSLSLQPPGCLGATAQ